MSGSASGRPNREPSGLLRNIGSSWIVTLATIGVTYFLLPFILHSLGEDGYAKLFPESAESDRLTWSKYRKATFDNLIRSQGSDGSWTGGMIGPIFITTTHLAILQLDNGTLPIYQK